MTIYIVILKKAKNRTYKNLLLLYLSFLYLDLYSFGELVEMVDMKL